MTKLSFKGLMLVGLSLVLTFAACNKSASNNQGPSITDPAAGDYGIDVAKFPESIPVTGGPITENKAEAEATTPQAAVVEPPCEWPADAISFEGNAPVYKSLTTDEAQDLSTQLSWNITTACAPDKVIITTPDGTSEYIGARAQNWSKDIPELMATTSYSLAIIHKNEVVHEESVEIPLVIIEENFEVSVMALNKATGNQHTSWTPQNNYQDPRTYILSYSFSAELDKVCIRSPHANGYVSGQQNILQEQQQQIAAAELAFNGQALPGGISWVSGNATGASVTAAGYSGGGPYSVTASSSFECFDKNSSTLDAQGAHYEGDFEFELDSSTVIESYGLLNGIKVFEKFVPLNVAILKPTTQLEVKRAIPGVGAEHYDLIENGLSSVIEFKMAFNDAARVALVTDVAQLYAESTWMASESNVKAINGMQPGSLAADKSAVCQVDPSDNASSSANHACVAAGFSATFVATVRALYPNRRMYVFDFNVHDYDEALFYAKASRYEMKSILIAVGYAGSLQLSDNVLTSIPRPGIKFSASADYSEVTNFCTNSFKNALFEDADAATFSGEVRGVKSLQIEQTGCKASQGWTETHPDINEPGVLSFSSKCTYDGMQPGYTVAIKDLLGNETRTPCKFNATNWNMKLRITSKTEQDYTDTYDFKFKKVAQIGPDPYRTMRVVKLAGHSSCSGTTFGADQEIRDERDFERIFSVSQQGVTCWKLAIEVQTLGGWKWVSWKSSDERVKSVNHSWDANTAGNWRASRTGSGSHTTPSGQEILSFPPRLRIDKWQRTSDYCWTKFLYIGDCGIACTIWDERIDSYQANYKLSGRHITSLATDCTRGSLSGASVGSSEKERFVDKPLSYSSGDDSGVRTKISYSCDVTATGVGDQSKVTRTFSRWAEALQGGSCRTGSP